MTPAQSGSSNKRYSRLELCNGDTLFKRIRHIYVTLSYDSTRVEMSGETIKRWRHLGSKYCNRAKQGTLSYFHFARDQKDPN